MHTVSARIVRSFLAASLLLAPLAGIGFAQDSKSTAVATELAKLMESKKVESVAARMPSASDQFVAALFLPGQLMVVWAQYTAPALINEKLTRREYRDVYIDLNSASVASSKTLVTDLGANGLRAKRQDDQPYDSQDVAGKAFLFDGNWRAAKISEDEYMKTFSTADEAYTRALSVLLEQLKKG